MQNNVVIKMTDEIKRWIIKQKGFDRVVVCPYCHKESVYPYEVCSNCKHVVKSPDEFKTLKSKKWW